jgi:heptosyltransferase I
LKKILIINPFGIGDVLFTTPVVRAIKENDPRAVIGYWCNERVREVLKDNPYLSEIFALSRGDLKKIFQVSKTAGIKKFFGLLRGIRKGRFDTLVDFSLDHRYSLIGKLLGIRKRVGFDYKGRGRFLTDKIAIEGYSGKHAVEYYLELLQPLAISPKSRKLDLFLSPAGNSRAAAILHAAGVSSDDLVVGIAPGAGGSWGENAALKHWPAIRFAQVADTLIAERRAKIFILGDAKERAIADVMVYAMKHKAVDLVGKTSLEELAALIARLRILIANDGGPLHMATALRIKTLSVFGPVDEGVYGPYPPSAEHIVVKADIDCRPCYQKFKLEACDRDRECVTSIDTEQVLKEVRRLI